MGAEQSTIADAIASRFNLTNNFRSDFGKVLSGFYSGAWRFTNRDEWYTVGDEPVTTGIALLSPEFHDRGAYEGKVSFEAMFDAVVSGENSD